METKYRNVTPFHYVTDLSAFQFIVETLLRNVIVQTSTFASRWNKRVSAPKIERLFLFFFLLLPRERKRERERSAFDQPVFVHVGLRYNPRVHYHRVPTSFHVLLFTDHRCYLANSSLVYATINYTIVLHVREKDEGKGIFFFFFNFLLLFLSFSFFLSFFFPRFFYLVHVDYDCRDTYTPDGLIKKNRDTSFDKIAPVYRGHCTYYVFLSVYPDLFRCLSRFENLLHNLG